MSCPRCGAPAADGANFCTACGLELRTDTTQRRASATDEPDQRDVLLVECPACSARNAASRVRCGRCHVELDEAAPDDEDRDVEPLDSDEPVLPAPERESASLLVVVTLVASIAVLAVLFSIAEARGGFGEDATAETSTAAPPDATRLPVAAARASSALPAAGAVAYGPDLLLDGDPRTAWNEGAAGPGRGEWVELTLADRAPVTRIVLWNGYQKGAAYLENGRVQTLRIELGDRRFSVEMLDVQGPQAIDLPEPVTATRIRLTIEQLYDGARYADAALSDVEVYGQPAA